MVGVFEEIDSSFLTHFKLVLLSNTANDKWGREKLASDEITRKEWAEQLKKIRVSLQKDNFVEQMSRELVANKDRMALWKLCVLDSDKAPPSQKRRTTLGVDSSMFTPNKAPNEGFGTGGVKNEYMASGKLPSKGMTKVCSERNLKFKGFGINQNESMMMPAMEEFNLDKLDEKLDLLLKHEDMQ